MKLLYLTILISILASISCTKDVKMWERTQVEEAKMISFGFYKADNPDVLLKDYTVNKITSNNILILLPETVDKSSLIARFTINGSAVANVEENVQKSGETSNDFSVPVDYIISTKDYNAKYTVTVAKGDDYTWSAVPFTINDSAVSLRMFLNPTNGAPYIMYLQSRPSSNDQKGAMVSYENAQWKNLGVFSDGRVGSNYSFTFNSAGVPYVSYPDYSSTPAQKNTVKKFDGGTNWLQVGNKDVTTVAVTYNAIAFSNDSKLLLFSTLNAADVLKRRELGVSIFENNNWSTNHAIPGRSSNFSTFWPIAVQKNNEIYLGALNANAPQSISIYKYANNTWTTLIESWIDPNATGIHTNDLAMDVDEEGNVYLALADNSNTGQYKHRVMKYSSTTQQFKQIGSYIDGASGNTFMFELALSPTGTPYLFYRSSSNYPTLVYFDNESQDWSTPYVFELEVGTDLDIKFAPNGEAYAAYLKNRKLFVYKYSLP